MGGRLHAKSRKEKKNPIGIPPKARQIWTRKDDLIAFQGSSLVISKSTPLDSLTIISPRKSL